MFDQLKVLFVLTGASTYLGEFATDQKDSAARLKSAIDDPPQGSERADFLSFNGHLQPDLPGIWNKIKKTRINLQFLSTAC